MKHWPLDRPAITDEVPPRQLSMRCPACQHYGALLSVEADQDVANWRDGEYGAVPERAFGIRICPRPECHTAIFVVYEWKTIVASYPPEVLSVETANLPDEIAASLTEAVQDHAVGSYRSAAIMLRRVLELVCDDHKANGSNLKARLDALAGLAVLPKGFSDGLDALRFLGNDAAHLQARTYADIGDEEVRLAVDVVKLLLVNLYQTSDVIGRLQALQLRHEAEDGEASAASPPGAS